jgi:hypothetical protein
MTQPAPTEQKRLSLKEWIDDNEKLLTVTGVFAALTAYFSTLKEPYNYTGILSFGLFLLLLIEVWLSIPKLSYCALRLKLFQIGLFMFTSLVGGYFVESYRSILLKTSIGWSFLLYSMGLFGLVEMKHFQEWLQAHTKKHESIGGMIQLAIGLGLPMLLAWETSKLLPMILPP